MAENTVRNVLLGGWITSRPNIIEVGQNLLMGTILSEVKSAAAAAALAGNTGDGTVGSISVGPKVQKGTYKLIAVKTTAGGEFNVLSPAGYSCGMATIGEAFVSSEINFTITDGATPFVLGDGFTIAVNGSGKFKTVSAVAEDGAGSPEQVLMVDTDATEADVSAKGWESGEFDAALLIVTDGESAADYREQMRAKGMIHIDTVGGNY